MGNQSSQYGHSAIPLHFIGTNGVESCRQMTPSNPLDVTRCLVLASAHTHNAGVTRKIAGVPRDAVAFCLAVQ